MNNKREMKLVHEVQPERRRRQERSRKKWEQYIAEVTRNRGLELKTLKKMAQDKDQYRKWINSPSMKGNKRR